MIHKTYEDGILYNGDCLKVLPRLIEKGIKVDAVICDIPYGTTACAWDSVIPFDKMWDNLNNICNDNTPMCLFGSEPFSTLLRYSNLKMFRYDWIWHKSSSGSFATAKKMPMKFHEIISVFYKKLPTYNPQFQEYSDSVKGRFKEGEKVNTKNTKNTNHIQNGLCHNQEREFAISFTRGKYPESVQFFKSVTNSNGIKLHPTQKPVALMEYLVKTYTNEGDTVLDFTCGSGSTLVACRNLNRKFIGIELNEKYYQICKKRLKTECTKSIF